MKESIIKQIESERKVLEQSAWICMHPERYDIGLFESAKKEFAASKRRLSKLNKQYERL